MSTSEDRGISRRRKVAKSAAAVVLCLSLSLISGCIFQSAPAETPAPPVVADAPVEPLPPQIVALPADPARPAIAPGLPWSERTLAAMTLREKVGQMMMPWMLGDFSPAGSVGEARLHELIENQGVGGFIVSAGTPIDVAVKLNDMQEQSRIPLLIAADLEAGAGFRLRGAVHVPTNIDLGGATEFPSEMAVGATGDPELAYQMGRITAQEARAVGIHVPFAPVLDVNSNPDNPIINVRSFGEDPVQVARMGAAYVRGIGENGAIATGKHFPGHGDTGVDSHQALPLISATRARLDSVELVPFRAAIQAGIGGIMTAHISVPALAGGTNPATLAPAVMTGVLRDEMGFQGLVFTDAMDMAAIDRGFGRTEAPVLAVLAGADVILMPPSIPTAIDAIVGAVEGGRITRARIDASVLRILRVKESLHLDTNREVRPSEVHRMVGIPDHVAVATEIAEKSLVLLKNERNLLPLAGTRGAKVLSVVFRRTDTDVLAGRYFNGALRATYPQLTVRETERDTPERDWDALAGEARSSQLVVVSVYVTAWDAGAIPDELGEFIEGLAERRISHVVLSFGNPYLLREFPSAQAYLLAWSGSEVSQRAAARALLGDIPITGHTPTRIPPDFDVGAGIMLDARNGGQALAPAPAPPVAPGPRTLANLSMATNFVEASPADANMDARALDEVDRIIRSALIDSASAGAAVAIGRRGKLVRLRGYGTLDYDDARAATPATIFDLASLTKVVGTATGAMILEAEGRLDLDALVGRYLPWWKSGDARKNAVTVRQVLLHRAGLPAFQAWYRDHEGPESYKKAIHDQALEYDPGTRTVYSDLDFMVMGFIIEAISGTSLDRFLADRVFVPLGMEDTGFRPDSALLPRIAPTEVDTLWRKTHVHGVAHDENAYAMGGVAGHAGLFSTVWDLSIFADLMLSGGVLAHCTPKVGSGVACSDPRPDSVRLFPAETVARWTRRHDATSSRTLAWEVPEGANSSAGRFLSDAAFGHTGFTGTSIWVDPELDLYVVLLTNRVNPSRGNDRHLALRRAVAAAAARAILDRTVSERR